MNHACARAKVQFLPRAQFSRALPRAAFSRTHATGVVSEGEGTSWARWTGALTAPALDEQASTPNERWEEHLYRGTGTARHIEVRLLSGSITRTAVFRVEVRTTVFNEVYSKPLYLAGLDQPAEWAWDDTAGDRGVGDTLTLSDTPQGVAGRLLQPPQGNSQLLQGMGGQRDCPEGAWPKNEQCRPNPLTTLERA
jgi:hypothetical protein